MIYLGKKKGSVVKWANDGVTTPEWTIVGNTATYVSTGTRGTGILHGPLLAEGTYVDVFLATGYEAANANSVAFLGASSTYGSFNYMSTTSNYAAAYWSGIRYVNGNNQGTTFPVIGNQNYRISRTVGSNPGVNTNIRVSKIDGSGNVTTAGTDMVLTFNNAMHVVLFGQQSYNISTITWVRDGAL